MTDPKKNENLRLMMILGMVMTVPMILVCGPIAGYLLSHYILVRFFGAPEVSVPILTFLGFIVSGMQVYQLIQRIQQLDKK